MGSLLVITGPPGAGKSTLARAVAQRHERSVLVQGDAFFGFLAAGAIEPWLLESNLQNEIVTEAAACAAGRYAARGYASVYDGVLGAWVLQTFGGATGLAELDYVMLLPSVERCVERVATRQDHAFSDEPATRKMHAEFADAEIDPRHVFADPPDDLDALADAVLAATTAGTIAFAVPPPTGVR
jgi:cytidylate kinase